MPSTPSCCIFFFNSSARGGGQSARSDVDECGTSVGEREVWVASVECVAALARGGTWDSAALQQVSSSRIIYAPD